MTTPESHDPLQLRRQIRRDVFIDTLGNTALMLGLWGWFGTETGWNHLLKEPPVFIALTATGILNLIKLPARLRRLREWQRLR